MYQGPLLKNALHRVLCAFDLLFKGVMDGVHIKDTNGGVCCAEEAVWEDCNILIVWVSVNLIIWASRQCVRSIRCSWFVFKKKVILG